MSTLDDKGSFPNSASSSQIPDPKTVDSFHINADTDRERQSKHHTVGPGANQASPGSHKHDGTDSFLLLEGYTINGSRGTATAVPSLIAALVQLGATDATTA